MQRKEMQSLIVNFLATHPVSQTDLAKAADVSINTINEIVTGKMPDTILQTKTEVKIMGAMRAYDTV